MGETITTNQRKKETMTGEERYWAQQYRKVGRVYCYLTEEQAAFLGASLEERKTFPNRKAILESLCLLDDEEAPPKQ